jgi:LPS export ABC transporter protein LptC
MAVNPRNLLLTIMLAGGALATWVLARVSGEPEAPIADPGPAPQGNYLLDAVMHRTDDNGRLSHRILADRVEQETEDAEFVLEGMRVEYSPDSNVHWNVSAARGFADADRDALRLTEGVRLVYTTDAGRDETIFETNELHLDAEGRYATTNQLVTMQRGSSVMTATGLELDLNIDEWKLDSNVTIRASR